MVENSPHRIGPFKGIDKEINGIFSNMYIEIRVVKLRFWLLLGRMEGLGSSGRLVGSISTYPGTYKCPWSLVMAENPGRYSFYRPLYLAGLTVVATGTGGVSPNRDGRTVLQGGIARSKL